MNWWTAERLNPIRPLALEGVPQTPTYGDECFDSISGFLNHNVFIQRELANVA